jgi:flagellar assembly protein FliH
MKLSSKTGIVKNMESDIRVAVFDELVDAVDIVHIDQHFSDSVDTQYAVPKIINEKREPQEINRSDGHKIFVSKAQIEDIGLAVSDAKNNNTIIKRNFQKTPISSWIVGELAFEDTDIANDEINSKSFPHEAAKETKSEMGILEAKGVSKEIIESAKAEAGKIKQSALAEAASIRDAARQEGYQDGFAQVNSEIEILRTVQKTLQNLNDEIIKSSETKIIELVRLITEKIFSTGMALDATILRDIVARAINEASRLGNLKVYLNPTDLDKLKKLWRESELDYNGQKIQLASNNDVLPGGCFVEGDYGSVDARVDTQIKTVLNKLEEVQLDQVEE